jgi:hypothetical protein
MKSVAGNEDSGTRTHFARRPVDRDDAGAFENQVGLVRFVPVRTEDASWRQPGYTDRQVLRRGQVRTDQGLPFGLAALGSLLGGPTLPLTPCFFHNDRFRLHGALLPTVIEAKRARSRHDREHRRCAAR